MDWELEATRIAAAFGIAEKCQFVQDGVFSIFRRVENNASDTLKMRGGLLLEHFRKEESQLFFYVSNEETTSSFTIDNYDTYIFAPVPQTNIALARALFCLGMITPEIETKLGVFITTHEKLEWMVDYETAMNQ